MAKIKPKYEFLMGNHIKIYLSWGPYNEKEEPYIINVNGISCLITASCRAEAKFKAKKMNGIFIREFDLTDFLIYKNIENEKRK